MVWYVLYVNSRSEKKVAQRLSDKGIEVFCPIKIEERQWSDRIKKVEIPYFQSYVFAKFSSKQVNFVLETPGVVRRLYWMQKPAVIREEEMQEVISFFKTHSDIRQVNYSRGNQVEVTKGIFKDKKGVVLFNSKHQVVLSIYSLGCEFKVTLKKSNVCSSNEVNQKLLA